MAYSLNRKFSCPVELALELVAGKWGAVLLARLKDGPLHYRDLRLAVPRVSEKMLVMRLRDLCDYGLLRREKDGARGAPSVYRLTARGEALRPALQALHDFGAALAPQVGAAFFDDNASTSLPPPSAETTAPSSRAAGATPQRRPRRTPGRPSPPKRPLASRS